MSDEHEIQNQSDGAVSPIEQALARFVPAAPRLDRDRLMFLAGQASALASGQQLASGGCESPDNFDRSHSSDIGKLTLPARRMRGSGRAWLWPASTAALAATSLALLIALVARPAPQTQIVYRARLIEVPVPTAPATRADVASHDPSSPAPPLAAGVRPDRTAAAAASNGNYLRSRDVALRLGLDALGSGPRTGEEAAPAPTYRDLLEVLTATGARALREPSPADHM
jgi:hypothetical protein